MAPEQKLVIYGAGGFARELLELVRDINTRRSHWDVLGFIDDNEGNWGKVINGLPVLGGLSWVREQSSKPAAVLGIGSPATRMRVAQRLRDHVGGFPSLVHPSVVMSTHVTIGEGVIITAGNILTANIEIGDFSLLNLMCTVGHDCRLGRYVTVSPGASISGNVHIGDGCDVGTGAAIVQGVEIGEWSVLGAGAVVARSLPANCTAVGVPAKVIKERQPGWQLT